MDKLALSVATLYTLAAAQFVICVVITASHYGPPAYNPLTTTISDLQALNCGTFQGAYICSPLHAVANLSVAVLGLLIVVGSLLIRPLLPGGRRRDVAVGFIILAGAAAFANAFTPEDVTWTGDLVTAIIAFLGANFGLIQIGRAVSSESRWRDYGLFSQALGAFGLGAFILDGFGLGAVIGEGAIEWLIIAPILVWAPATGFRLMLVQKLRLDHQPEGAKIVAARTDTRSSPAPRRLRR